MQFVGSVFCIVAIIVIALAVISSLISWVVRRLRSPKLKDVLSKVEKSEEMGSVYFDKLAKAGIKSTNDFIKKGAHPRGRKEIEYTTGIGKDLILKWICFVDLLRIRDITVEYIYLLKETRVSSVVEVAQRNPEVYHKILVETNEEKKIAGKPFSVDMVRDWIEQAKKLPQIIEY